MGFEPMNRGFADLYNRPLCQGTIPHLYEFGVVFQVILSKKFAGLMLEFF